MLSFETTLCQTLRVLQHRTRPQVFDLGVSQFLDCASSRVEDCGNSRLWEHERSCKCRCSRGSRENTAITSPSRYTCRERTGNGEAGRHRSITRYRHHCWMLRLVSSRLVVTIATIATTLLVLSSGTGSESSWTSTRSPGVRMGSTTLAM